MKATMNVTKKMLLAVLVAGALITQAALFAGCSACQIAKSVREAAAAAAVANKGLAGELDIDPTEAVSVVLSAVDAALEAMPADEDAVRAARECLLDPCSNCGNGVTTIDNLKVCRINEQLCALRECCAHVSKRLEKHMHEAKKCCKKIRNDIEDVEELVESVIDQNAECCSITDSRLGDPANPSWPIPPCMSSTDDVISMIDAAQLDLMTWVKGLYALMYNVYLCTCNPCVQVL